MSRRLSDQEIDMFIESENEDLIENINDAARKLQSLWNKYCKKEGWNYEDGDFS